MESSQLQFGLITSLDFLELPTQNLLHFPRRIDFFECEFETPAINVMAVRFLTVNKSTFTEQFHSAHL
jgi:hypothetical protein